MIKVLLVDDEVWVRRGITEKADWKTLDAQVAGEARNGLEGLELARKLLPDIVITDMKMPIMDGVEFISKLHGELPEIKIIVISGYSDYEYTRQALLNKAVDYILKPIEPQIINDVLRHAILERQKDHGNGKTVNGLNVEQSQNIPVTVAAKGLCNIIEEVKEYVACHYNEKINLHLISKKFFVSETYFCKVFKKETGLNFLDYLTSVRMEKARVLIENHHARLNEAATLVGYEDARHFSKLYRKYLSERSEIPFDQ